MRPLRSVTACVARTEVTRRRLSAAATPASTTTTTTHNDNSANPRCSVGGRCLDLSSPRRLYILCWSELSRRRLLPAVSPTAGHLTTPTVAGLPGLCENFRPTTSKSGPILRLLSSHWATSVVRTRVVGVANVGDSLRRLSSLQHRIYNLLGLATAGLSRRILLARA